jgi:hypothetical protein
VSDHAWFQGLKLECHELLSNFGFNCNLCLCDVVDSLPQAVPVLLARGALVLQLCCGLPLRFHVTAGVVLNSSEPPVRGQRAAVQTMSVAAALLCACIVTELHIVIGLTAAVCASFIIYILPGRGVTENKHSTAV